MAENPGDSVGKEYIFKYGLDRIIPPSEKTGGVFAIEQRAFRRERVTRCRDCVNSFSRSFCMCCGYFSNFEDGYYVVVAPDGFCAWGEESED